MNRLLTVAVGLFLAAGSARAEMTAADCKALAPHIEPITKTLEPLNRSAASVLAAGALVSLIKVEHETESQAVEKANGMLIKAAEDIGDQVDVLSRSLDNLMTAMARRCGLIE